MATSNEQKWGRAELIALRDRAREAMDSGDRQAGFVAAWMDQALQARASAASASTTATAASTGQRRR